ncbi:CoA transferase [Pseudonocardiaceae bacterium YIM PH 21723]|nr:CoA transferase [Pseudonocardiaceae bacterium YIM PH 21723]
MAGPLQGVRVVELAGMPPAAFTTMMLADLGAEVVRIDRATTNERGITPPAGPLDRGKHPLALNLKDPADLERLHAISRVADVLIEGFRPGVAERLGLGPQELLAANTRLVYGRLTGWGQDGPLADRAGHDINYIAISGALDPVGLAGSRPVVPSNYVADFAGGGMLLAIGVLGALLERERSGRGQVIDSAMVDGSSLLTSFLHGMLANGLIAGPRGTNTLDSGAPFYDTYECADGGYVAVGCVEYPFYLQLLDGLGLAEDEDLPFYMDRTTWPELKEVLAAKFRERTRDEWITVFDGTDACVSPVLGLEDAPLHPHNVARAAFVEVDGVRQPAPAPRFDRTPADTPASSADRAPTEEVLRGWGA